VQRFPSSSFTASWRLLRLLQSISTALSLRLFQYSSLHSIARSAPPPLTAAAKCLTLCIKVCLFFLGSANTLKPSQFSPGDDSIISESNMYSLLNYIAATSKGIKRIFFQPTPFQLPLHLLDHLPQRSKLVSSQNRHVGLLTYVISCSLRYAHHLVIVL
jgi:hypothetical protein